MPTFATNVNKEKAELIRKDAEAKGLSLSDWQREAFDEKLADRSSSGLTVSSLIKSDAEIPAPYNPIWNTGPQPTTPVPVPITTEKKGDAT